MCYSLEKWDNYYDKIDWQVTRLARVFRQYSDAVLRGKFSQWKELKEFRWKKVATDYRAFTGKNLPKIPPKETPQFGGCQHRDSC